MFSLYDKDLNIVDANTASLKPFNFTHEQIIGRNLLDIVPDFKNSARHKIYLEVLDTGKPYCIDEFTLHPSLGRLRLRVHIFRVSTGLLGVSSVNITDLKETIDELDMFAYRSSHDLRAPISSILGLLSVAKNEVNDVDTAFEYFNIIKQQAEKLDNILLKLIETTHIRKEEKIIQQIDFNKLLDQVVATFMDSEDFNTISFEREINLTEKFYSDKRLLFSVLYNLLSNSLKYKKNIAVGSFVKTTISGGCGGIKICITDNGIGIANNIQHDIFKMFFRGTDQASGAGLGLYTVTNCIKKLNGQIKLESKESEGSTFILYLPNERIEKRSEINLNNAL